MNAKLGLTVIGILGIGLLSLSGCGKSSANEINEQKVTFVKDAQSSKPRIWYDVLSTGNLNKDAEVYHIIVTQNGKANVYEVGTGKSDLSGHNIGPAYDLKDFSGKSDAQVIKMAKKADKFTFDFNAEQYSTDNGSYSKPKVPNVTYKNSANTIKAKVATDSSGNNVVAEKIFPARLKFYGSKTNPSSKYVYQFNKYASLSDGEQDAVETDVFKTTVSPTTILKDKYVGYQSAPFTGSDDVEGLLVTKTTNDKATVHFDTTKTKGVSESDNDEFE